MSLQDFINENIVFVITLIAVALTTYVEIRLRVFNQAIDIEGLKSRSSETEKTQNQIAVTFAEIKKDLEFIKIQMDDIKKKLQI